MHNIGAREDDLRTLSPGWLIRGTAPSATGGDNVLDLGVGELLGEVLEVDLHELATLNVLQRLHLRHTHTKLI